MNEISVHILKSKMENEEEYQLIDVREVHEYEAGNLGGENIPMGEILGMVEIVRRDVPVIIHCRSGRRSGAVVNALSSQLGLENVYNLIGGIQAWVEEFDSQIEIV